MSTKPRDTISWDEYFMGIALFVSQKSRDPNTQVGSVICDSLNRFVSAGFNGAPMGIDCNDIPWERDNEDELKNKYLYIQHSEDNTILFADKKDLSTCKIYSTLFPCAECARKIIQVQISEVIYLNDKYHDTKSCVAARKMFDLAGVKYRQFVPKKKKIIIEF